MKPPAFGPESDQRMIYFSIIYHIFISLFLFMDRASSRSWTVARPAMGEDPPRRPAERCGNSPADAGSPAFRPLVPVRGRPADTVSAAMANGRTIRPHGNLPSPGGNRFGHGKASPGPVRALFCCFPANRPGAVVPALRKYHHPRTTGERRFRPAPLPRMKARRGLSGKLRAGTAAGRRSGRSHVPGLVRPQCLGGTRLRRFRGAMFHVKHFPGQFRPVLPFLSCFPPG